MSADESSQKLVLPRDMSEKIMSMLRPKARPASVLLFHGNQLQFKTDTLSEDEIEFLIGNHAEKNNYRGVTQTNKLSIIHGARALMLGFRFQTEVDRARWKHNEDFEMYRDAVYGIE